MAGILPKTMAGILPKTMVGILPRIMAGIMVRTMEGSKHTSEYSKAVRLIGDASRVCAFTGAGISVESGIPPFRGEGGLWSKYDPSLFHIDYFLREPSRSWQLIKKLFYDEFPDSKPNLAHKFLASMEREGLLQCVITQNIDNLHHEAGSVNIYEFHGNSKRLRCMDCNNISSVKDVVLSLLPPHCSLCEGLLKPDMVFFGEPIPQEVGERSFEEARNADVMLVIGSTGGVMPASMIPVTAREMGADIIEINITPSNFTPHATIFLEGQATRVMSNLAAGLGLSMKNPNSQIHG